METENGMVPFMGIWPLKQVDGVTGGSKVLPEHLGQLYDSSSAALSGTQRWKLQVLLEDFAGIFSKGDHDMSLKKNGSP